MTALGVPRDLRDVTPAWLTEALRTGGALGEASVTGFTFEPINEGKGFMSQVARLHLDYDSVAAGSPSSVLLKLPSDSHDLQLLTDRLGNRRREVQFYDELAGCGPISTPQSYHCEIDPNTGRTVMLLEWLTGARQGDSVAGCTSEEAKGCLVEIARFHAHWWESTQPDSPEWVPLKSDEASAYRDLYAAAWFELQAKAGENMPEGLRRIGNRLEPHVSRIKAMLARPPRTLIHGDYRLDNCFFREEAGSISPIIFDWEFCVRGRGAYDVATFLGEVLPPERRRAEEMGLLQAYHSALIAGGATGYTFEECLHDYRLSMLEVFVFWIVTGGFCDFEGERATAYLRGSLERFDAAISDLASMDLLAADHDGLPTRTP